MIANTEALKSQKRKTICEWFNINWCKSLQLLLVVTTMKNYYNDVAFTHDGKSMIFD